MEKQLINEILRIKLLSNYDTKNTFSENSEIIIERTTLKTLAKDTRYLEALYLELDDILKMTGPLGAKGMFKTADDVIFALKNQSMSVADFGKLNRGVLKTSKNPVLRKSAAGWVVSTETFSKAFSSGTATERLAKLKSKNPNMSDDLLRDLHTANELRLTNLGKSGKNIGQGGKTVGQGGKTGGQGGKNININNINNNSNNFIHSVEYTRELNKYADDWMRTTGKDADELARNNNFKNFEDWGRRDPEGMIRVMESEARTGKGFFGRAFAKGRRWATVWSIVKWGALAVGAYWLYKQLFSGSNECADEPGTHMVEGVGCVPNEPPKPTPDVDPVVTDTTTNQGGGGEKYIECEPPYYKGCIGKKGDDNIKKAQDCLGVTPNGFFNQETEDALKNKINKKSFTSSDMSAICAKSYGGGSFQI